jgi:Serine dehydratase alpha chain
VKAVTAAQLSMASDGVYSVTLDEAIEAMRLTAADMSVKYKETSLSVSALQVLSAHPLNYFRRQGLAVRADCRLQFSNFTNFQ